MTSTTIPPEDERARAELFDALDDVPLAHPHTTESLLKRIRSKSPEYALSYVKAAVEFSCMQKIRELQSRRSQPDSDRKAIIEECAQKALYYCGPLTPAAIWEAIRSLKHSDTTPTPGLEEAVAAARRIIQWVEITGEGPSDAWPTTCGDAIAISRALLTLSDATRKR